MNIFCTGLILLLAYNSVFAELKFDKEAIEDEIFHNESSYAFAFSFKNDGKKNIKITKIETTCNCTIVTLEKSTYYPNETGEIRGSFHLENKCGQQENQIVLSTNDISQPQIKLSLKIKILDEYTIRPRLVYWEKEKNAVSQTVILTINKLGWQLSGVGYDMNKFSVITKNENGKHTIKITPVSTMENFRDTIKITIKNGKDETRTLMVYALIK